MSTPPQGDAKISKVRITNVGVALWTKSILSLSHLPFGLTGWTLEKAIRASALISLYFEAVNGTVNHKDDEESTKVHKTFRSCLESNNSPSHQNC